MKLKSFRIYNYKSIRDSGDCELSLEGITLLAGQNESGKSSILEALRDFDYNTDKINSDARPDDEEDSAPTIECTFDVKEEDLADLDTAKGEPYEIPQAARQVLLKLGEVTLRRTDGDVYSVVNKEVLDALEGEPNDNAGRKPDGAAEEGLDEEVEGDPEPSAKEALAVALMRQTPFIIHFSSFDDCLPSKIYLKDYEEKKGAGYRSVRDFIDLARISVARLKAIDDPKQLGNYLESKSALITGDFLKYWSQKFDGRNQVEITAELHNDKAGAFLSFYVRDGRLRRYPAQRSKGFLWFLSFYLRLAAQSVENQNLGSVILIDEPGAYLHSRAQKDVLKTLKEKIVSTQSQIIFSTHSSDMIDPDRLNRVRLVLNRIGKGTKICKPTDIAARENGDTEFADALSPVTAAIGKDLSRDFSIVSKKNVLVEGISDFYYLSAFRDKPAFKIPSDIRIIPMTGALSIPHMVSIMTGWGLEFAIVMDHDSQSGAAYKKLIEELDVPESKIFRIQGGKAIEDLFSVRDFKKFVLSDTDAIWPENLSQSAFAGGQKVALSRKFFENYKEKSPPLEAVTKDKFGKIFEFIKGAF